MFDIKLILIMFFITILKCLAIQSPASNPLWIGFHDTFVIELTIFLV